MPRAAPVTRATLPFNRLTSDSALTTKVARGAL
jgi:hypothetical protein